MKNGYDKKYSSYWSMRLFTQLSYPISQTYVRNSIALSYVAVDTEIFWPVGLQQVQQWYCYYRKRERDILREAPYVVPQDYLYLPCRTKVNNKV